MIIDGPNLDMLGTICGLGSRAYEFALQFTLHPN